MVLLECLYHLIYVLALITVYNVETASRNDCDVVTVEGLRSEIVCPYTANLVEQRLNVNIYRRHFDGTYYFLAIACLWDRDDLRCIKGVSGVNFGGHDNHTVTIQIPATSKRDAGIYNCNYDSITPPNDIHQCRLYVKDKTINCTGVSVTEGDDVTVKCHFNGNLNNTKDSFIFRHKPEGSQEFESILSCIYVSTNDKWRCSAITSFTSWTINGSTVTVRSPKATEQHSGTYYCDNVPSAFPAVRVDQCTVVVSVRATTPKVVINVTANTLSPSRTTAPTKPADTTSRPAEGNANDTRRIVIIISTVTTVFAFLILVIILICYRSIKRKRFQKVPSQVKLVKY